MSTCPKCGTRLAIVTADSPPAGTTTESPAAGSRPPDAAGDNVVDVLEDLLGRIDDRSLDERELEFVSGIRERFAKYGDRTLLSPKQRKWLADLASKPAAAPERYVATDDDVPF